jgi:hypothetical protein
LIVRDSSVSFSDNFWKPWQGFVESRRYIP